MCDVSASDHPSPPAERILCVTGRLAETLVEQVISQVNATCGPQLEVQVVGISVAALMHVDWLLRKLHIDQRYDRVIVPGWCQGDLQKLASHFGMPFERGPREIQELPVWLKRGKLPPVDLSIFDISILAEINHAPQLPLDQLIAISESLVAQGADLIDLGCIPGSDWSDVSTAVRELRARGIRVSIDSFSQLEVESAVAAGAELVLSCNSTNLDWARRLPAEVVAIPDDPRQLESLWSTVEELERAGARYRLDPILEPIGFGFAASLARYFETRRRLPDCAMMMGVGNLTEMTAVDSAGVNLLLAAICQELHIHSVLTTEVINWARTSVREFDVARRIARHAVTARTVPKHWTTDLVQLRDPRLTVLGQPVLDEMAREIKDPNFRIFVERGQIHVLNRDGYWTGTDPHVLFSQFSAAGTPLDAAHAFYLGHELAKASIALTLGKQYEQDLALRWGMLTVHESTRHERAAAQEAGQ